MGTDSWYDYCLYLNWDDGTWPICVNYSEAVTQPTFSMKQFIWLDDEFDN